ncbi:MAG: endopeptidase IV [Legionellaceae bacterium]|nr:endopeptidase IV [Legionellaceae bacterium]
MNTRLNAWLLGVALLGATQLTYAQSAEAYENENKDSSRSPLGCKDAGYQYQLNVLTILPGAAGEQQSLYFIYNRLDKPINLFQMLKDDSTRSTYLNHTIRPQQWAVLSTSEKELKYICTIAGVKSRYGKVINCSESLKVCEYVRVKFGLNNKGNYWVVNSNTRGSAVGDVVRYGIIPR